MKLKPFIITTIFFFFGLLSLASSQNVNAQEKITYDQVKIQKNYYKKALDSARTSFIDTHLSQQHNQAMSDLENYQLDNKTSRYLHFQRHLKVRKNLSGIDLMVNYLENK